jgi:hypothetical protein
MRIGSKFHAFETLKSHFQRETSALFRSRPDRNHSNTLGLPHPESGRAILGGRASASEACTGSQQIYGLDYGLLKAVIQGELRKKMGHGAAQKPPAQRVTA